jgi:5-(carboxyamino)imidazole ribonucleotide synthase
LRLGILGSGQLGAMLAAAARRLGVETRVYAPEPGPATAAATHGEIAPWEDERALARFAASVDLVTYELEHVPLAAAQRLAERVPIRPSLAALEATGDRVRERQLLAALGVPQTAWLRVDGLADAGEVARAIGFPCLLKRRIAGYDGRGQAWAARPEDFAAACAAVGGPAIAERRVAWRREVSLLVVRGADGALAWYDPVENHHRDGILRVSRAPAAGLPAADLARLQGHARAVLAALDYVGVLTLELFDTGDGWLVNELAPRVHNSGHWTIEGAETSQFENHVRAILGWPLGSPAPRGPAAMVNLIGAVPPLPGLLRVPGAGVHLYGKLPRPGRKLGHVTVTARDDERLAARLAQVIEAVEGVPPSARAPGASAAVAGAPAPPRLAPPCRPLG